MMEVKQDKAFMQAIECLPPALAARLALQEDQKEIEELRLRAGHPPAIKTAIGEKTIALDCITPQELREVLSRAAQYSVHSYAESMKKGFVTIAGGHRLGLCGTAATENGQVTGIRNLSSINLRFARQIADVQEQIIPWIGKGPPQSVLVLSPPGCGKTTLLREWLRIVSDNGYTVAIADERSELAALQGGIAGFAIGRCTDVIEGCSKKQAVQMLLKTMSPSLLVMDEITSPEDMEAVSLCAHCGTAVLASAHARDFADLNRRPLYHSLMELNVFRYIVQIQMENGRRIYQRKEWEEGICSN